MDDPMENLHIGKASFGWEFSFRAHPALGITDTASWWQVIEESEENGGYILDEYGDKKSLETLKEIVESKKGGLSHGRLDARENLTPDEEKYLKINHGPSSYFHWLDSEGNSFIDTDFS
jgi:hypothetical protein